MIKHRPTWCPTCKYCLPQQGASSPKCLNKIPPEVFIGESAIKCYAYTKLEAISQAIYIGREEEGKPRQNGDSNSCKFVAKNKNGGKTMKYIAYYGAWGTSILCLGLLVFKLIVLAININTTCDMVEAKLEVLTIVILPFVAVLCAWVVCDMQKRMKDL